MMWGPERLSNLLWVTQLAGGGGDHASWEDSHQRLCSQLLGSLLSSLFLT